MTIKGNAPRCGVVRYQQPVFTHRSMSAPSQIKPSLRVFDSIDALGAINDQWQTLAVNTLEQNINYEPTPMLSVLRNIPYAQWQIVTVWMSDTLIGLFPVQRVSLMPIPVQQYTTLFENHFMSCVPLVHRQFTDTAIHGFLDWLDKGKAKILFISEVVQGSVYADALACIVRKRQHVHESIQTLDRAALATGISYDQYWQTGFNAKSRNSLNRKRRQLEKLGSINTRIVHSDSSAVSALLDDLVAVESMSWKSHAGTAIALHRNLKKFMLETAMYAAQQDRLMLAVLYSGNKPVAAQYGLENDRRLLIYKVGYDEQYARYSPGQLLMLDIVSHALEKGRYTLIDSCADADAVMFNRCLGDRVELSKQRIASSHMLSSTLLSTVRRLRSLKSA